MGHQFFLDTPGTSCQEEFLRDSVPRWILTHAQWVHALYWEGSSFLCYQRYHLGSSTGTSEPVFPPPFSPDDSKEGPGDLLQGLLLSLLFSPSHPSCPNLPHFPPSVASHPPPSSFPLFIAPTPSLLPNSLLIFSHCLRNLIWIWENNWC